MKKESTTIVVLEKRVSAYGERVELKQLLHSRPAESIKAVIHDGEVAHGDAPQNMRYITFSGRYYQERRVVYDIQENAWFCNGKPASWQETGIHKDDDGYAVLGNADVAELTGIKVPLTGRFADNGDPFITKPVSAVLYGYNAVICALNSVPVTRWAQVAARGFTQCEPDRELARDFNKIGFPFHGGRLPNFRHPAGCYAHTITGADVGALRHRGGYETATCLFGYDKNGDFVHKWICDYEKVDDSAIFFELCGLPHQRIESVAAAEFAATLTRHKDWDGVGLPPYLPSRADRPILEWAVI